MATLRTQFDQALTNIQINGDKAERSIAVQGEVRSVLEADEQLPGVGRRHQADRLVQAQYRDLPREGRRRVRQADGIGHERSPGSCVRRRLECAGPRVRHPRRTTESKHQGRLL